MKTKLVVALLAFGMLLGSLLVAGPARGIATINLDPPKYDPLMSVYVPGEQLTFTVSIAGGDPTIYDVLVVWNDGVTFTNWSGSQFDDITLTGTSIGLTFGIPSI